METIEGPVHKGCCSPDSLKYSSLGILVVQGAVAAVSMRYSRSHPGDMFILSSFVLSTEVLKLIFSLLLVYKDEPELKSWLKSLREHIWDNKLNTLVVAIPALVFYIQQNLLYVAASHLDAATFHISQQAKIFTTAIFSVIILKRKFLANHWSALLILVIGILIVQFSSGHKHGISAPGENRLLGIGAALGAALCSGFAGVFFEKILKGSGVSIWMRNVQLAAASIVFGAFNCFVLDAKLVREHGLFFGYDAFNIYLLVLQATGGMLIAVVVKYADNLLKGFAVCLGIILSSFFSVLIFNYKLTPQFGLGTLLVFGSIVLYGYPYSSPKILPKQVTKTFVL